jgi:hypothetical protein
MTCGICASVCVEGKVEGAVGIWRAGNEESVVVSNSVWKEFFLESQIESNREQK